MVTSVVAVACLAIGIGLVLRAVVMVAVGGRGRFPLDPWVSLIAGYVVILLGRALLT